MLELASSLEAPIWGIRSATLAIVSGSRLKNSRFPETEAKTGFDRHHVAEAAVKSTKFSALVGGKLGTSTRHGRAELAV